MNNDNASQDIFAFQHAILPVLLGWAAGSVTSGVLWMCSPRSWLRGLGGQFVGWGLVNGVIALLGLAGAEKNHLRLLDGQISTTEHDHQAHIFENIVWVNAVLDVFYVLGGRWYSNRNPDDAVRRGAGVGIMLQGAFLLVWDIILGTLTRRRRNVLQAGRRA